jgi:transposase
VEVIMAHTRRSVHSFPVLDPHAAGIDVHSETHWVAVNPGSAPIDPNLPADLPPEVRQFGAYSADLEQLADWLTLCQVTSVAMESTGVYWIPLFELLESRGFKVVLVDGRQTRQVTGRPKSDRLDCQWIRRLHACGLLAASFRPTEDIVVLRSFIRQRQSLLADGARHVQHMQKALEQMNVKLTEVLSDIVGMTGLLIIRAILAGERDAKVLAHLRHVNCHKSEAEIALALQGNWRDEHLFCLKQAVDLHEKYQKLVDECDRRIEKCLKSFDDRSGGVPLPPKASRTREKSRQPSEPKFAVRQLLHRMTGVDLTVIEGIDERTAMVVLSEIGLDVSQFATEKNFTSWLGLCPQHRGSAGHIKSRRIRRSANRAARALRMAAQGCHHAKNAMGAFYRRIQMRNGGPRAVVATARKIAERVYRLLKFGGEYERRSAEVYEAEYRAKVLNGMRRRAKELGYQLVENTEMPMSS